MDYASTAKHLHTAGAAVAVDDWSAYARPELLRAAKAESRPGIHLHPGNTPEGALLTAYKKWAERFCLKLAAHAPVQPFESPNVLVRSGLYFNEFEGDVVERPSDEWLKAIREADVVQGAAQPFHRNPYSYTVVLSEHEGEVACTDDSVLWRQPNELMILTGRDYDEMHYGSTSARHANFQLVAGPRVVLTFRMTPEFWDIVRMRDELGLGEWSPRESQLGLEVDKTIADQ